MPKKIFKLNNAANETSKPQLTFDIPHKYAFVK